ncbi:hypothetical protein J6590_067014 [Homalodisca vitripennis]|nr:hypothetical protein J6590_067014 [Homalodisca vitripennis]
MRPRTLLAIVQIPYLEQCSYSALCELWLPLFVGMKRPAHNLSYRMWKPLYVSSTV